MLHIAWNVSLTIETTFWKEMEITQLYNYTACMYIYYPLSTTTVHIYIYIYIYIYVLINSKYYIYVLYEIQFL